MADISMCLNKECPSKELCYRYTAVETPGWQSYADFKVPEGKQKCKDYWPNEGYRNAIIQ